MTFQQAIITCFRKYFTLSGRASRSEYWWFVLFNFLGGLIASATETFINNVSGTPGGPTLLSGAFSLVTLIPGFTAGVRRMHDTGRSGWHLFYPLIAILGLSTFVGLFGPASGDVTQISGGFGLIVAIALIVVVLSPFIVIWWLTRPSEPGQNQYGPNPHEVHP